MPDENSGQHPTGDTVSKLFLPTPLPPPIQEGMVSEDRGSGSNPDKNATKELAKDVHWLQHATFWSQIGLGIIGIIALWIYGQQLCEMRKTTKTTQQAVTDSDFNFRRDERAWIGFSFVPGSITFTVSKPFSVPTLLINTGKTPAKDVQGNIVVGVFERGKPLDFAYTPGHANYRIAAGTIFPNGSITESFQAMRHGEKKAEAIIIDKPLLTELLNSSQLVIVHGTITYSDIFGIQHWTRYCRVVSNPSLIPDDCVRYNETDNN